jgi:indole-3-glycerol phosphate synthase
MATGQAKLKGIISAGGILDRIVEKRIERLEQAKQQRSPGELIEACAKTDARVRSFKEALSRKDRTNIIAEIKRQSPSKGIIREDFDHLDIARRYAQAGAAAMSVLTEADFFGGDLRYLEEIHAQTHVPLLRKDFIIDAYQIFEAALAGASAVLLITAVLDDELLASFINQSEELGIDALVEVHTEDEMRRAAQANAGVIGVNNRDLTTFKVDLETSIRLAEYAPPDALLVSESGITTREDINRLKAAGYQAFLIGEHLMRQKEIGTALLSLIEIDE